MKVTGRGVEMGSARVWAWSFGVAKWNAADGTLNHACQVE